MREVAAVIGAGGLGLAAARRIAVDRRLILADLDQKRLDASGEALANEGYEVTCVSTDITSLESMQSLGHEVAKAGTLRTLVLAAGISPHMGTPERILEVNMIGTVLVLDTFLSLATQGTTAVVIASNAGYLAPVAAEVERRLALEPVHALMEIVRRVKGWDSGLGAYWLSKRANQLRVEAEASRWGKRGARIVSISPGIISTGMTHFERNQGSKIDEAILATPAGRIGVPEDISAAIAWVPGPQASFLTGVDVRVDGGMIAALRSEDYAPTDDPTDMKV